jgi:hypothetical protein
MKTSSRCVNPRSSACGNMVSFPLLSPFQTCNKFFVIRYDVINTAYTVYFTTTCRFMCET